MKRLALLLVLSSSLFAAEGKWTPQQIPQLDPQWLRQLGLELPPGRLWDPARGTGLLAATVNIGGCSGGWISAEGLFITNHHCLFGLLQEHATPENDIITKGYLAAGRDRELKSATARLTMPRRFTDVTTEVVSSVPGGATDAQRFRAIDKEKHEIVSACETQPRVRCLVAAHDGGVQYVLQEMTEIADVRLVYAPPRAVGEFGGEIDNWMWPRHNGDFAIGRAYVDGQPYRPEFFFPLSTAGVRPGDFVMVLGYPGTTYRSLTAAEMEERHLSFLARSELYREWIDLLESTTRGSAEGKITVADTLKTLSNRQKNAAGQLAGFKRGNILEKQRRADDSVRRWLGEKGGSAVGMEAHEELAMLATEQKETFDRDFLLDHIRIATPANLPLGPKALILAWTVARAAQERALPDVERKAVFMTRNLERLHQRLEREQKSVFPPADRAIFESFVRRALELPRSARVAAIDEAFGAPAPVSLAARIGDLYAKSRVLDPMERAKMLGESVPQLRARRDPLLDLGFAIDRDIRELAERKDRWEGTVSRLRPVWRRAVIERAGKPIAPDANSTLRVSFGHVQGYSPRNAVTYAPQTTLAGVVEKHTGSDPFDVPDFILKAAAASEQSRWRDATLGDVPVGFLADADTTGGNSGSPVVNGRGELVGVNFDRVWENVANDFGFLPDLGRSISVDVRYLLWILDQTAGAASLLKELGVTPAPPTGGTSGAARPSYEP